MDLEEFEPQLSLEQLKSENCALKEEIERMKREVRSLKADMIKPVRGGIYTLTPVDGSSQLEKAIVCHMKPFSNDWFLYYGLYLKKNGDNILHVYDENSIALCSRKNHLCACLTKRHVGQCNVLEDYNVRPSTPEEVKMAEKALAASGYVWKGDRLEDIYDHRSPTVMTLNKRVKRMKKAIKRKQVKILGLLKEFSRLSDKHRFAQDDICKLKSKIERLQWISEHVDEEVDKRMKTYVDACRFDKLAYKTELDGKITKIGSQMQSFIDGFRAYLKKLSDYSVNGMREGSDSIIQGAHESIVTLAKVEEEINHLTEIEPEQ